MRLDEVKAELETLKHDIDEDTWRFDEFPRFAPWVPSYRQKSEALEIAINCVETCINEANRIKYQEAGDL